MPSFRLCPDDPLVTTLRKVFKANIVRIPRNKIQPLSVIGRKGSDLKFLGSLQDILDGSPDLGLAPESKPMAEISGNKTRTIEFNFGVKILEGFLQGFGLSSPSVSEAFKGTKEVSFGFPEMQDVYVETLKIGQALAGKKLHKNNPVLAPYYAGDGELLVVDGVMAGKNFTMSLDKTVDSDTEVSLGTIGEVLEVDDTSVKLDKTSKKEIKFEGEEPLTFAFTCLSLVIDPVTDTITSVGTGDKDLVFEKSAPKKTVVDEDPSMIDIEI